MGDEIVLHDEENDIDYGFTVDSVTQYTPAFYVFMTIDDARELFGAGSDEYNVVFQTRIWRLILQDFTQPQQRPI